MKLLAEILTGLVALQHFYIAYLEMFAWTTKGRKTFKSLPQHLFEPTKKMAANQGLYNGFLAAGLVWSFCITDVSWSKYVSTFFLACIIIAGLYGAVTVQKSIFFVQALPAILALTAVLLV